MAEITTVIPVVRESVAAILRLHTVRPERLRKGKTRPARIGAALVGSGFCIVSDRYLLTAQHILNNRQQRDPNDRFYALTVPQNGDPAYPFPVVGFPIENQNIDIAVLEIGPCNQEGIHIPALPVTSAPQPDGSRVVTVGFPAPEVVSIACDPNGNFVGGQLFLKSHANEGIVSAQYVVGGVQLYELNVGWHHGESGGPIVSVSEPLAAFSLMQHYRNVQSPHGITAGPHRGLALSQIMGDLAGLGATIV